MQGEADIIELLNECLTAELTAINQYYVHSKMCANWGYSRLAKKKMDESMEEMRHADQLIDRILLLDGIPNMQRLFPVTVGESAPEQHELDLAMEVAARDRLNKGIALCREKGDNGSRHLLEEILGHEEEGIDWLEAQLGQIEELGKAHYLAQQIFE
jgi:bacterioferritin